MDEARVLDPAPCERGPELRARPDDVDRGSELVEHHLRLDVRHVRPRPDLARRRHDHGLVRLAGSRVVDDREGLALDRIARREPAHDVFGRLLETHDHEAVPFAEALHGAERLDRPLQLAGGDRIERVGDLPVGDGGGALRLHAGQHSRPGPWLQPSRGLQRQSGTGRGAPARFWTSQSAGTIASAAAPIASAATPSSLSATPPTIASAAPTKAPS